MQVKRAAKIYIRNLPSGNKSYRVDLGKINGKRVTKDFKTEFEAQQFASKANQELANRKIGALQDLAASTRYEVLAALERLAQFNATITEAVEFFIRYSRTSKPPILVADAVKQFRADKLSNNRTLRYVDAMEANYLKPLEKAFPRRLLNQITQDEIRKFIYTGNRSPKTVENYIRSLNAFFNHFIRLGHVTLNPLEKVDRPILTEASPSFLTVPEVESMLHYALDNGLKAECASMVLILFCGVRFEEVEKLSWEAINFSTAKVTVAAGIAKKRRKRVNNVSGNAIAWLELCRSEGMIAPKNYVNRLRSVRKGAGISYSQNAMRHSFASYHVALHQEAAATAYMLGHPDANLLYNTYRELVAPEEAAKYWKILPRQLVDAEKAKQAQSEAMLDDIMSQL